MVRIKFTVHPRTPVVSPKFSLMASNRATEITVQPGETSADQPEEYLADQQSGDFIDSETASDNSRRVKVAAAAALAGISYDFGQSSVTKTQIAQS
jgi:hypothetical protein